MNHLVAGIPLLSLALAASAAPVNTPALYALPAGESDTLSAASTFDAMRVAGDLTVAGAAVTCADVATTGGVVRATGSGASLGNAMSTVWSVSGDAPDGAVTRLVAEAAGKMGVKELHLDLDDAGLAAAPGFDGTFDFMSISNAAVTLRRCWNESSATGRIAVAGASTLGRPNGYDGAGTFQKGAFEIALRDGASFKFDTMNQKGTLAEPAASVRVTGAGDVRVVSGTELTGGYTFPLRAGTVFDHAGTLAFEPNCTGTRIVFQDGGVLGPRLRRLETVASGYQVLMNVSGGVELRLPPETALVDNDVFAGTGTLLLDASEGPVSFAGNVSAEDTCTLVLRKVGGAEARVASTNLAELVVDEGVVRLVKDCAVRRLHVAPGAKVVVDGCALVLADGAYLLDAALESVNGGKVLKKGSGISDVYGSSSFDAPLRVTSGTLEFSRYGLPYRHWRFVIRKHGTAATADNWFAIDRLWLFADDGSRLGAGLSLQAQDVGAPTELAEGKVRFVAPETLVHSTSDSWNGIDRLPNLFTRPNETVNLNNYPWLKGLSRDIDPADPSTWVAIEWKLPAATAKPVVGYNLAYGYPGRYPTSWSLEYFDEAAGGWVVADLRENQKVVPPPNSWDAYYYYDGVAITSLLGQSPRECFHISGNRQGGLAPLARPLSVQVDAGATLDLRAFTEGVQEIGALTLDVAGAGAVRGGRLAEQGVLAVTGAADAVAVTEIPVDLDGVADVDRLADWTVTRFGAPAPGLSLVYDAENRRIVLPEVRTVTVTEAGARDVFAGIPDGVDVCVDVASGVTCTNLSALAGGRTVYKRGAGTLVLDRPAPDAAPAFVVLQGTLAGAADNAFGIGNVTVLGSTTATSRVLLGSADAGTVFDNDFLVEGDSSAAHPAFTFITSGLKTTTVRGSVTAHGYLAITDSGSGSAQGRELVFFEGDVDARGYTVLYSTDNSTQWKGALRAGSLRAATTYPHMGRHDLWSPANEIGCLDMGYVSCLARAADVLGGARLNFNGDNPEYGRGYFQFNVGPAQTCAYVSQEDAKVKVKRINNNVAALTLTLTGGVARAVTRSEFRETGAGKRLTLVVDAGNADFVQEVQDSVSSMAGDIVVRRGALRFSGVASAASVPAIRVPGGAFEVATSAEGAFAGVTNVTVGAGARLGVDAAAVAPFGTAAGESASATALDLDAAAVLELPAGAVVDVDRLSVAGLPKPAGSYTGAGGVAGRVLPQISGTGVLRVRRGNGGTLLIFR